MFTTRPLHSGTKGLDMTNSFNVLAAASKVDLSSGWNKFWTELEKASGIQGIFTLMTAIGALMVVGSVLKWMWDKRRSGGGGGGGKGSEGVLWTLVVGCMLAAPNLLIPAILTVIDIVANIFINLFKSTAGGGK